MNVDRGIHIKVKLKVVTPYRLSLGEAAPHMFLI